MEVLVGELYRGSEGDLVEVIGLSEMCDLEAVAALTVGGGSLVVMRRDRFLEEYAHWGPAPSPQ